MAGQVTAPPRAVFHPARAFAATGGTKVVLLAEGKIPAYSAQNPSRSDAAMSLSSRWSHHAGVGRAPGEDLSWV